MERDARIFVAGHRGLVGSAIVRALVGQGFLDLVLRTRDELDLTDQRAVEGFFSAERPHYVFLAAARVGGILANQKYPAQFLRDNIAIQTNVIDAAYRYGVRKLLFLGSSCIYPKHARQPMREPDLLTGPLEPTNEWYAIAKIAGVKMCEAYRLQYGFNAIAVLPTNLYGPGDNFSLSGSHVLPALIRKIHQAVVSRSQEVEVWGSGSPRREFMHVDDLADACLFLMQSSSDVTLANIGWGKDISIRELAESLARTIGFRGCLRFDPSKPDGTPRKLLDTSRMQTLGWTPRIPLSLGLASTYKWYVDHINQLRE